MNEFIKLFKILYQWKLPIGVKSCQAKSANRAHYDEGETYNDKGAKVGADTYGYQRVTNISPCIFMAKELGYRLVPVSQKMLVRGRFGYIYDITIHISIKYSWLLPTNGSCFCKGGSPELRLFHAQGNGLQWCQPSTLQAGTSRTQKNQTPSGFEAAPSSKTTRKRDGFIPPPAAKSAGRWRGIRACLFEVPTGALTCHRLSLAFSYDSQNKNE